MSTRTYRFIHNTMDLASQNEEIVTATEGALRYEIKSDNDIGKLSLSQFPDELILEILSYLDVNDLLIASRVSCNLYLFNTNLLKLLFLISPWIVINKCAPSYLITYEPFPSIPFSMHSVFMMHPTPCLAVFPIELLLQISWVNEYTSPGLPLLPEVWGGILSR